MNPRPRRWNHGEHGETRRQTGVKDYASSYNDAPDQDSTEAVIIRIAETLPRQMGAIVCAVLAANGVEAATSLLKAWKIEVPKA